MEVINKNSSRNNKRYDEINSINSVKKRYLNSCKVKKIIPKRVIII